MDVADDVHREAKKWNRAPAGQKALKKRIDGLDGIIGYLQDQIGYLQAQLEEQESNRRVLLEGILTTDKIMELHRLDYNQYAIAKQLHVSPPTVNRILQDSQCLCKRLPCRKR